MPFPWLFLISGAAIFIQMLLLWLLSLRLKNASIVDIFWGIGFIFTAWLAFALTPQGYLPRKILLCTLVSLWGLRLALHIGFRNIGRPEDFRYAAWRAEHGPRWWWRSLLQVFLLQGAILWIVSAPISAAQTSGFPAILTPLDWLGAWTAALGLLFEAAADIQLARFKADPKNAGRLLTGGLWKYSRHPNYFGEAVVWWGFYLIALAAGRWWTVFSPLLMTFLLIRVSGVAMLERSLRQRPGYDEYIRRTSAFFPRPPRP